MILSNRRFKLNSILLSVLLILLFSELLAFQLVNLAEGNFIIPQIPELPRIYIKNDGNVEPSSVPIQRIENMYVLTGDISNYTIVIQRNDILLDCAGHILDGSYGSKGIFLNGVTNVTIKNIEVRRFDKALEISVSSQIKIIECRLHNNVKGVVVQSSENVLISKNKIEVTSHPQDLSGFVPVYCLSISLSSNCLVSDNELISTMQYGTKLERGIRLENSSAITLSNNILKNCGLFVSNSFKNTVSNNTAEGKPLVYLEDTPQGIIENAGQAILINCQNMKVSNLVSPNMGIQLIGTDKSEIINNEADISLKNSQANILSGNKGEIRLVNSSSNLITENLAKSILITNSSENIIFRNNCTSDAYPASIFCEGFNNTIKENILEASNTGISIRGSSNTIAYNTVINAYMAVRVGDNSNVILKNNIMNCAVGVDIGDSSHNIILGNNITGCGLWGIIIASGTNNTVYENNFTKNNIGVALGSTVSRANNNVFHHNLFINNTRHVGKNWDEYGANIWDNGQVGNYWSDYNGTDANGNGIGDTPYIIDAENQDRFPLMSPIYQSESDTSDSNQLPDNAATPPGSQPEPSLIIIVTVIIIGCLVAFTVYLVFKHRNLAKASKGSYKKRE